jgi:hypothetical protein
MHVRLLSFGCDAVCFEAGGSIFIRNHGVHLLNVAATQNTTLNLYSFLKTGHQDSHPYKQQKIYQNILRSEFLKTVYPLYLENDFINNFIT